MPCSAKSALAVSSRRRAGAGFAAFFEGSGFFGDSGMPAAEVSASVRTDPRVTEIPDRQTGLFTCTVTTVTRSLLTRRLHVDLVRVATAACRRSHR
ncbi:putative leader peptide [Rhodococcus sp. NPDC047139]|uniref:putative leader peptide n=1 Tax=Rhodococcus sp. NPDC047139 TaxID=3155141 RepID=UPI0033F05615